MSEQLSQTCWHSGLLASSCGNSSPSITSHSASVHLTLNIHYSAIPHQDKAECEGEPTAKSLYWENTQICNTEQNRHNFFILFSFYYFGYYIQRRLHIWWF